MRLLFVATIAPRPLNPTRGIFVHQMAKGLLSLGHEVDILVPVRIFPPAELLACLIKPTKWGRVPGTFNRWLKEWVNASSEVIYEGVRYIYKRFTTLPQVSHAGKDCQSFVDSDAGWLMSRFISGEYSLVLGHFAETIPLAHYLAARINCPSGVYIHEDIADYCRLVSESYVTTNLEKCHYIFTNSHRSERQLARMAHLDKDIKVVHLGIDDIFRSDEPGCKGKPGRIVNVVCVSRFTQRKNQQILLDAVIEWNRSSSPFQLHLRLVGDESPYREGLVQYAKKARAEKMVSFVYALNLEVVHEQLRLADIFVFSSKFESFGVVLIEAASQGVPIIASNEIGAFNELKLYGWDICSFDPFHAESLTSAIGRVLHDYDLYSDLAKKLREFVLLEFSWEKSASEIVAALRG